MLVHSWETEAKSGSTCVDFIPVWTFCLHNCNLYYPLASVSHNPSHDFSLFFGCTEIFFPRDAFLFLSQYTEEYRVHSATGQAAKAAHSKGLSDGIQSFFQPGFLPPYFSFLISSCVLHHLAPGKYSPFSFILLCSNSHLVLIFKSKL